MTDLRKTIIAKSDQLNSDDLMGGPITITVRDVTSKDNADQPISIFYEGDNNKPWKPCKSMRRVLLQLWGWDGKAYVGRKLTLHRDEKVMWGGEQVGGIRISHMSDIDGPMTMPLTATRGNKKPYTVRPLEANKPAPAQPAETNLKAMAEQIRSFIANAADAGDLDAIWTVEYAAQLKEIKAGSVVAFDFLQGEHNKKLQSFEAQ